jgi:hypothetical protein
MTSALRTLQCFRPLWAKLSYRRAERVFYGKDAVMRCIDSSTALQIVKKITVSLLDFAMFNDSFSIRYSPAEQGREHRPSSGAVRCDGSRPCPKWACTKRRSKWSKSQERSFTEQVTRTNARDIRITVQILSLSWDEIWTWISLFYGQLIRQDRESVVCVWCFACFTKSLCRFILGRLFSDNIERIIIATNERQRLVNLLSKLSRIHLLFVSNPFFATNIWKSSTFRH